MADNTAQISFEFFPPKTPKGLENLLIAAEQFAQYQPEYVSVTFGAGGSDQDNTAKTVQQIRNVTQMAVAPHISCVNMTKERMRKMLSEYQKNGVEYLVALRGDVPEGQENESDFQYANELVEFIREETADHFTIAVAAYPEYHPEAKSPLADFEYFKQKIAAGANGAITQYFYNPDAFFEFADNCEQQGVKVPVYPGIMPITNYKQLASFSDRCGAEIPQWIRRRLAYYDEKDDMMSLREFGEHVVTMHCETLLNNGAPGLHFYTLNKFEPTHHILQNLMLSHMATQSASDA